MPAISLAAWTAFIASLVPLAAFWAIAPAYPRSVSLMLWAAAVAVWLLVLLGDAFLATPRLARWLVRGVPAVLLAVAVAVAGPAASVGFLLWAAAATALGARLLGRPAGVSATERLALAFLTGLALLLSVASLLLRVQVHHPWTWTLACLVMAFTWRRPLGDLLAEVRAQARGWEDASLGGAPMATLLAAAVWAWGAVGALTPIAAADDLTQRLRMATELLNWHRYSFDVSVQVWAAAPWAIDLAFALPYLIAQGSEGVKVFVNGSYHLAAAVLLLGLLLRRLPLRPALLFLLGALSVPLSMAVNHTLHTEGPTAALVLAVFLLWLTQRHGRPPLGVLVAAALLMALIGAAKSSNLVLSLLLGLLWLPVLWRQVRVRPLYALPLLAAFATVLIPYGINWLRTGNPLLPLFNAVFRSPYFLPVNFVNPTFEGMFGPGLFHGLFLHATRHLETGTDVAGGLAVFLLLPAALLLAWRADTERRAALAVALGFSLAVLAGQQYLRYLYPVLGLALFGISRLWEPPLARPGELARLLWRGWWSLLLLLSTGIGVAAMPRAFWQTWPQYLRLLLQPDGHAIYLRQVAPERALNQAANADLGRHARVLYVTAPAGAELLGTPIYPNLYSYRAWKATQNLAGDADVLRVLRELGVTHVIPRSPAQEPGSEAQRSLVLRVESLARAHGRVIATSGHLSLIRLDDGFVWPRTLWELPVADQGAALSATVNVSAERALGGRVPLWIEAQGICDAPSSRPWVDLRWQGGRPAVPFDSKIESCLADPARPGQAVFRIAVRIDSPAGTEGVVLRFGTLPGPGARLQQARVRMLAVP